MSTKSKSKSTYAITKEEWQEVFKDTITVKRQKELLLKISKRLNFFNEELFTLFEDINYLDDITNQGGVKGNLTVCENSEHFEDIEEIFGYPYIRNFWLWDDFWIKKIENYDKKQELEEKRLEEEDDKIDQTNAEEELRLAISTFKGLKLSQHTKDLIKEKFGHILN